MLAAVHHSKARIVTVYAALAASALLAFTVSLMSGSVEMDFRQLWQGMTATGTLAHVLIFDLRLPRTLSAFAAGGVPHWPESCCWLAS